MKKLYRIQITSCSKQGIWYASKRGKEYDAELFCKNLWNKDSIIFKVSDTMHVYPVDCRVVNERCVEAYSKEEEVGN